MMHVITGLNAGGAELMLLKLITAMDRTQFNPSVVSLTDIGDIGGKIASLGVEVDCLGMNRSEIDVAALVRLSRMMRKRSPDLVHTWLYHADLIGGLAARLAGNVPVIWNIRNSRLEPRYLKWTTRIVVKLCAVLSRTLPRRILACAESARAAHVAIGYGASKITVIPNGFDTWVFSPDADASAAIRAELSVAQDTVLIALIGRFDPHKGHRYFISAAGKLKAMQRSRNVRFVFCGAGVDSQNPALQDWLRAAGILDETILLGFRDDMPRILAAVDILTSASITEGFSNVIGEAMACGVPCVVTDVGDSASIVGDTGRIVPPRNPEALVSAWSELLELGPKGRRDLGRAARRRIEENFSLPAIAERYERVYQEVLA